MTKSPAKPQPAALRAAGTATASNGRSEDQDNAVTIATTPAIDHIGINVPEASFQFWQDLLVHLGAELDLDGNHFDARIGQGPFLCVTATKEPYTATGYHRRHTGLSHLARPPTSAPRQVALAGVEDDRLVADEVVDDHGVGDITG